MKKIANILTLLLLLIGVATHAQDYAKVDNIVAAYSTSFKSVDDLAAKINKDFQSDEDKARAIFTWIATNVKYDMDAYYLRQGPVAFSYRTPEEKEAKMKKMRDELALKTLKTKKGVCEGYSTLFERLAAKTGLEAAIIPGTSKSHPTHIGKQPGASDHAWNAVKISGQWQLLDVTWGAGTVTGEKPAFQFKFNDKYFLANPETFVLNHYPDNEKWLLTDASKADFANTPLYYGNYLMGGYEFTSPGIGTFTDKSVNVVPFKIRNLKPTDRVAYSFTKDRIFKEVKPRQNGDLAEFEVMLPPNSNGYLTVYINQRSVAAYRINRS
ncbi:MAG: transglutaminase domain-containing protein [Flavobacterium sp.]